MARAGTEEKKKAESAMNYRRTKQENKGRNLGSVFASRKMKRNLKNIATVLVQNLLGSMRLMPKRRAQKNMLLWRKLLLFIRSIWQIKRIWKIAKR